MSAATLYNCRRAYGGMDTDAVKELKELREQNSRLDGPIKIVSIVDEHTRECLGGLVERSITGEHLIVELDRVAAQRAPIDCVASWLVGLTSKQPHTTVRQRFVHSSNARRATDRNPRQARTGQSVNTDRGVGDAIVNGRDPTVRLACVGPRGSTTPLPGGTTNTTGSILNGFVKPLWRLSFRMGCGRAAWPRGR